MSEYIAKLEGYAELEVSIIRATKINKVLKAIKKLDEIPKEDEFNFKSRSETLLQKWNKILESETGSPNAAAATNGTTNGTTNGDAAKAAPEKETTETKPEAKPEAKTDEPNTDAKVEPTESTNGVTESRDEEKPKAEPEADTVMEDAKPESAPKEESATVEPSTVCCLVNRPLDWFWTRADDSYRMLPPQRQQRQQRPPSQRLLHHEPLPQYYESHAMFYNTNRLYR